MFEENVLLFLLKKKKTTTEKQPTNQLKNQKTTKKTPKTQKTTKTAESSLCFEVFILRFPDFSWSFHTAGWDTVSPYVSLQSWLSMMGDI